MANRFSLKALSLLYCVLLCSLVATAQNDRAAITGRITDAQGAVVSDATVKITRVETGQVTTLTTDSGGHFSTGSILKVGTYKVEASHAGFKSATSDPFDLQIGAVREVNLPLPVGSASENVTVTTEGSQLNTETSSVGGVIVGRQITELPLRDRNFTNLALLTPGVSRAYLGSGLSDESAFNQGDPNAGGVGISNTAGDTPAARFSRSGGAAISANGIRANNNNFTLDGVDNNEPIYGSIGVFPNPDAIQEFRVETNLAKAEAGRGGAQVNTTLRSGTNDIHGSLFYFGQNAALNATHSEINRQRSILIAKGSTPDQAATQLPKTATHIHEFGGTIGGPIIKNRTFFFFDYLGQRNLIPVAFHSAVPTAGARVGDFSAFTAQLKDPITGLPFPGNVIPNLTSRPDFSPIAQKVFNLYPLPNVPNVKDPSRDTNPNYLGQRQNQETIDSFDAKVDHRLFGNNNVSGRYTRDNQQRVRANFFPGNLPTAGFGAGNELGNTRQISITDTQAFKPTLLNEFRFGYTSVHLGIDNCGVEGACGVSTSWCTDMGIPNCNKGTLATTGGPLIGFGGGNPPGELEFLGDNGIFLEQSKSFYIADSVTVISGKHTFKVGAEVRPRYLDQLGGGYGSLKGAFAWGGGGKTGVNQANALLSQNADFSNSGTIAGGDNPFSLNTTEYSIFVQDDWKTTDKLTLNLGVRWDVFPLYDESNGRISNFDPVTNTFTQASGGSDRLVNTRYNNFAPRLGFAYGFGEKRQFVARGGYGIFYTNGGFGGNYPLALNPPNVNQVFGPPAGQIVNFQTGPPVATVTNPPVITPGTPFDIIPNDLKTESSQEFNLGWEWQPGQDYIIDLGYVGTRSRHLVASRQLGTSGNGLGSVAYRTANANCAAPPCFFNSVVDFENRANANYDGLQAKLNKSFSHGLVGTAAYTWSHNIDNSTGLFTGPGDLRGNNGGPINPLDFSADRANSSLDHRHLFNSSLVWDLPFGRGKSYGGNVSEGLDRVFGGWQLNFIASAQTGQHYSVTSNGTLAALIGDPFANVQPGLALNAAAFKSVNTGGPAAPGTTCVTNLAGSLVCYGDSGRNRFTGEGFFRTDLSVFKNIKVNERAQFQIGLEFFNLLNSDNHVVPCADVGCSGSTPFGTYNNALPPRTVQYRGKFIF